MVVGWQIENLTKITYMLLNLKCFIFVKLIIRYIRETVGGAAYFAAYETISQTSTDISFTKKICLQVLGGSAAGALKRSFSLILDNHTYL